MKRYLKSILLYFVWALLGSGLTFVGIMCLEPFPIMARIVVPIVGSLVISVIITLLLFLSEAVYFLFLAKSKLKTTKLIFKAKYVFGWEMKYIRSLLARKSFEIECKEEKEFIEFGKMMIGMNKKRPPQ